MDIFPGGEARFTSEKLDERGRRIVTECFGGGWRRRTRYWDGGAAEIFIYNVLDSTITDYDLDALRKSWRLEWSHNSLQYNLITGHENDGPKIYQGFVSEFIHKIEQEYGMNQ